MSLAKAKIRHLISGSIRSSCHKMTGLCHDRPCMHGGTCSEGWNRYICDCTQTSFTGATCGNGNLFCIGFYMFRIIIVAGRVITQYTGRVVNICS
jgi:hypothetical protein